MVKVRKVKWFSFTDMEENTRMLVKRLVDRLELISNEDIAAGQSAYMRNQFAFFGVKTPERKLIQKEFFQSQLLPPIEELDEVIQFLWDQPQRELQHTAMDLVEKYHRRFRREDLSLLEYMVSHKQWWDTIDTVATKLMGAYFKMYPSERVLAVDRWLKGDDFWLHRCGILFQLKYKRDTDTDLLARAILPVRQSNEFFIQKAIGWVLREYRKTNPPWVDAFLNAHDFKPLSRREALKHSK